MRVLSSEPEEIPMPMADLHVHSDHSRDGRSSVREILGTAIKRGLRAISITDHDTVNGSLEAMEIVEEEHLPLEIVPGVEISTSEGHLLAYWIEKDVDPGMSLRETVEVVRGLGGITSLAHPFQFYRHGAVGIGCFRFVDCVEIFNAKGLGVFNRLSDIMRRKFGKGVSAGSDAHKAEFVGYGVVVYESNLKEEMLSAKCEVRGRTYVPIIDSRNLQRSSGSR